MKASNTTPISGQHLIDLGYKPGRWFQTALHDINEQNLSGDAMVAYLDAHQPKTIDLLEQPVPLP